MNYQAKSKAELINELKKLQKENSSLKALYQNDIIERRQAEEVIKKSEERLRDIMFTMADWVWEVDENGVYTYSSGKGADLLGRSINDIIGKTPFDFMQPDEAKRVAAIFSEIAANKEPIKDLVNWNIRKNGEKVCLLTNGVPILDEEGNFRGYRGVDKDITERWRVEKELLNREEKFRALFESAKDGILLLTTEGKIVSLNTSFATMHGYTIEEMLSMGIRDLDVPETAKHVPARIQRLLAGEMLSFEVEHYCKNGQTVPIEVSANLVSIGGENFILGFHRDISERKQAEEKLLESEKLLNEAQHLARMGSWLWIIETDMVLWSKELYELNQRNPQLPAPSYSELASYYTKESWELLCQAVEKAVSEGTPYEMELDIVRPDGSILHTNTWGKAIKDKSGRVIQLYGTVQDITERKKAEEALQKSEEKLSSIMNSMTEVVWSVSWPDFKLLYVSPSVEKLYGRSIQEFIEKPLLWREAIHPDDRNRNFNGFELLQKEKYVEDERRIVRPDGSIVWVHDRSHLVRDENGIPIRVDGLVLDITERKKVEEELIKAKEKAEENEVRLKEQVRLLDLIFAHTLDNMALLDKDYNFIKVSETYAKSCQRDISEFIGRNHFDLYPSDFKEEADEVKEKKIIYSKHARPFIYADHPEWGTTYWDIGFVPILDKNEEIELFILTLKDISEEVRSELKLIKQNEELKVAKEKAIESDRLKTAFLANISHEIRTPMNGILGFSHLLLAPDISDEKLKQYVKVIDNCGNQLLSIIDDLIDVSKIEANQMTVKIHPANINSIIRELYELLQQRAIISRINFLFTKELNDDNCVILTDGNRLRQILINLINNALKFTSQGYVKYGYRLKKEMIEFFVEDTGIGIAPEMQEKIFDRFTQVETAFSKMSGGTGLGLSISKALVELLGGKIWLNSEIGKGSVFYFTIPYVQAEKEKNEKPMIASKIVRNVSENTILIAEDDNSNYFYLSEVLAGMNIRIIRANNGEEAIEKVKHNPSINLILMDMKMPVLDGYKTTKEIKKIRKDIPIIAQTAYALSSDREKALEAGCDDYIPKPLNLDLLIELIKKHFNEF